MHGFVGLSAKYQDSDIHISSGWVVVGGKPSFSTNIVYILENKYIVKNNAYCE